MEGHGGEGREEKSAPLRRGWGWAAAVRTADLRPPHCSRFTAGPAVPAPQNSSTNKHWRPRLLVPPPPWLCSLPAPTPLRGEPGSGVRRTGPAPLLPPACRPGARLGGSPSELACSSLRPLTYLPRIRGGGVGVPSSSRSSAAGRVGREATPRGCLRLGPGLTGRDRWALLRGAARSLRVERRPREGLEESAACTVTAALIPGAGLERGAGEGGEGAGKEGARGGERERAGAGSVHTRARTALSLTHSSLPRFLPLPGPQCLPGAPQPPTRRLLHARADPRARSRSPQLKLCPGPAPTSFLVAETGQG